MSRRSLDRAFNQAQYRERCRSAPQRSKRVPQQSTVVAKDAPSEEVDAIARIITAAQQKDFLTALELPLPSVDELGLPVWPYNKNDITRQYRRMCLLVHPDKNSGERARHAFQLLNKAYKALLDEDQRNEILKTASEAALMEKEKCEARATVDERIKINAEKKQQKRKLSKIQHDSFQSEILRQVQERKMHQSMKRQKMAVSRYTTKESCSEEAELSEKASESQEKGLDGTEIVAVRSHLAVRVGDEKKSEKDRIREKLKSKKQRDDSEDEIEIQCDEDETSNEWQGAVLTKSRAARQKPRFLF